MNISASDIAESEGRAACRNMFSSGCLPELEVINPYGDGILSDSWASGFRDEMRHQVRERLRQHNIAVIDTASYNHA